MCVDEYGVFDVFLYFLCWEWRAIWRAAAFELCFDDVFHVFECDAYVHVWVVFDPSFPYFVVFDGRDALVYPVGVDALYEFCGVAVFWFVFEELLCVKV